MYNLRIDNKIIIVTGGYGYLGKGIVESLVSHGAFVIVAARDEDKFFQTFQGRDNIKFIYFDISNTSSIQKGFQKIFDEFGRIDTLINNAYYSKGQSPEKMSDENCSLGIDGTLSSVFRTIREIIPYFKNQGNGKIINVSSQYGINAPAFEVYEKSEEFINPPHYGAAKAGVLQLTRYYASYLGKLNIQVNAVTPGAFPSVKVQENINFINELKTKTCLNRIGSPDDLGGIFTFLSSDASNFITGQNFIVDGGWTIK
jgi:gluconate 5-dehydrogenase